MHETALITGASGGLGEEFARLAAARGMDIILVARSKDALTRLAEELIAQHNIKAHVVAVDLSEPSSIQTIVEHLDRHSIAVTVLINNAGFGAYGLFAHNNIHTLEEMIAVNIAALTTLTKQILPGMIQRRYGRILNVASTAAFQPGPLMAAYYATKAYVLNLSLALSNETNGTGVTVTCLCPGPTKTGFASHAGMQKSRLFTLGVMNAETVARIGFAAMMKGKPIVIAGLRNRIGVFATRFVSRMFAARLARSVQSPQ